MTRKTFYPNEFVDKPHKNSEFVENYVFNIDPASESIFIHFMLLWAARMPMSLHDATMREVMQKLTPKRILCIHYISFPQLRSL